MLALVALLSFVAAVPLTVLSGQLGDAVIAAVIGVPCAAVGWAVARRHPGNPIGWLFLTISVLPCSSARPAETTGIWPTSRATTSRSPPPGWPWPAFWGLSLTLFGVAVLLFPDGTLSSRFWRGGPAAVLGAVRGRVPGHLQPPIAGALSAHPVRVDSTACAYRRRSSHRLVRRHPGTTGPLGVTRAVAGLHRPAGPELAARHRGPAPAAEMAGQRRRHQHRVPRFGHRRTARRAPRYTLAPGAIGSAAWFGVAALPVVDRGGHSQVPAVRHRPDHLPACWPTRS